MNFHFPIPINFIVIPLVTIVTAWQGAKYAKQGAGSEWYRELPKPKWTPGGGTIREIWIFLYILTTLAVMWYWNVPIFSVFHYFVAAILFYNAYLNAHWNKLFFVEHNIPKALSEMKRMNVAALIATLVMLVQAPIAAVGMLPYIIWVWIATRLTKEILQAEKPVDTLTSKAT